MNKLTRRITALGLCAALCLGGVGVAKAQGGENAPAAQTADVQSVTAAPAASQAATKDETVYVLAGADGAVQKIIVSDWIRNTAAADVLTDRSTLQGIETVQGDAQYTLSGADMLVWDAQGDDVYYQGSSERELPVGLSVSYWLDGEAITAEALAGKSGRVTIRFDYENRQYDLVELDGKQEKIYVPFAMLTGMLLDNETFRNVTVSNGKCINDGDRTIVIGFALPGLQEDLALHGDTLSLPDYVEITADVTDFSLGMTVTVASNAIFNALDSAQLDTDGLTDGLQMLTDAVTQLTDGSSALYDGLCTLLEKSDALVSGISQLASGAKELRDGAAKADSSAAALAAGLDTLSASSNDLNLGAKQVFETLLATATQQLQAAGVSAPALTIENYAAVLNECIAALDETAVYEQALAQVTAAVEAMRPSITEQVTAAVRAQVFAAVAGMSEAEYADAVAAGLISAEQQAAIADAVAAQMASDAVQESIAQNVETQVQQAIAEQMASDAVQAQLAAAAQGAQSLIALKASLDSYQAFYLGLRSYTAGVDSAAAGAGELKDGTAALKSGAATLYQGALQLQNGAPALVDGVTQLRDGTMTLSDGLAQFAEQGIAALASLVDSDIAGLAARLEATVAVSQRYCSFSGLADGMDGQVKFIYRTAEISAD